MSHTPLDPAAICNDFDWFELINVVSFTGAEYSAYTDKSDPGFIAALHDTPQIKSLHYMWYNSPIRAKYDLPCSIRYGHFYGDQDPIVVQISWYSAEGLLHRDGDRPALIKISSCSWYKNGDLHRDDDKPAVVGADGRFEWHTNNIQTRGNDLPSEVNSCFVAYIFNDNKSYRRHRGDGQPAIISRKRVEYWTNGKIDKIVKQRKSDCA